MPVGYLLSSRACNRRRPRTGPLWLTVVLGATACGGGASPATTEHSPTPVATLRVTAGDSQEGTLGLPLPAEVTFTVRDARGLASVGTPVQFVVVSGGGTVPVATRVTDDDGEVDTPWTLGLASEDQLLEARVEGLPAARATAVGTFCGKVSCAESLLQGSWKLMALDTYDGTGQAVHPDVVPRRMGSHWFWLALTPYPSSDVTHENPSIYVGAVGSALRLPYGGSNPVVGPEPGASYLSDPDLTWDAATHRFWLYYRQVNNGRNEILLTRSRDGAHWGSVIHVLSAPNHEIVSPAVVHDAPHAPWVMFSVNSYANGCTADLTTVQRRVSTDGLHWDPPSGTDLGQPGQRVWHLEVQWVASRNEYWAVYNTYPAGGSCATNALYFSRSADGVRWEAFPTPILRSGDLPEFNDVVYRSTFLVDEGGDSVRLWVSGARLGQNGYDWRIATSMQSVPELLATLGRPAGAAARGEGVRRDLPPPEPDLPASGGGTMPPPLPRRIGR